MHEREPVCFDRKGGDGIFLLLPFVLFLDNQAPFIRE